MKLISKLLWGFLSGTICIMYKSDSKAACTYSLTSLQFVGNNTTLNHSLCSAATICASHDPNRTDCGGNWITNLDTEVAEIIYARQLCSKNYYVYACKNSGGITIYPVDERIAVNYCKKDIVCSSCPSGGLTQSASMMMIHDGGYAANNYYYVCSNIDAITGQKLSGFYMQEILLNCGGYTTSNLNMITKCFQMPGKTYTDPLGSYQFISSCFYTK